MANNKTAKRNAQKTQPAKTSQAKTPSQPKERPEETLKTAPKNDAGVALTLAPAAALYMRRMRSAFWGIVTIGGIALLTFIFTLASPAVFGPDYAGVGKENGASSNFGAYVDFLKTYPWLSMVRFSVFFFVIPILICLGAYCYYLTKYNKTVEAGLLAQTKKKN